MDSKVGTWSWGDGSISKVFSQTRGPEFETPYNTTYNTTQNKKQSQRCGCAPAVSVLGNQRQEDPWSPLDNPSSRTCEPQACEKICLKTKKQRTKQTTPPKQGGEGLMKACQAGFWPLHTHTGFLVSLYVRRQLNNISKIWRRAVTKNLYPGKLCQ